MLLVVGSFAVQALLLSVVTLAEAQHYDADYQISEDEDSAGYTNEHNSPDYSKYFNSASSAPQQEENSESGFVTPLDFSSFFGPPQTGFSSGNIQEELPQVKQGDAFVPDDLKLGFSDGPSFGSLDYFEQAQKETKNEETSEEKPGYISTNLPGGYQENIENFRKRSEKYRPLPTKKTEEEERQSYTKFKPSQVDLALTQPAYNKKYTQPSYPQYNFQSQKTPSYSPIPYNPQYLKYASPADSSYEYIPSPSQTVTTQSLKDIGCLKMNKKLPSDQFNKAPMTCYVCKDPKSGGQSEHCSYEQEPSPKSFYKSSSQTYGQKPETYRIKREDSKPYDPYEEVKAKSHRYYSQPEEFAGHYYKAPDFSEFEKYSPAEHRSDDEEEDEKSYSEKLSEELVKQKDNCKKIHKDGISCLVCENAETGGNYEQCSYQSEPNEKKYAYVRESKYDDDGESSPARESEGSTEGEREDDDDKVPKKFAESTGKLRRAGVVGLDPKLYGRPDSRKQSRVLNQESKQTEAKIKPEPYYDPTSKRDVDKVLEEFSKKDRSNCEQIKKKGMTCYVCIDKKGIKQEECMYISESRPQSSLVAYHEREILKNFNTPKLTEAESRLKLVVYPRKAADTEAHSSNQKEKKKKKETEPEPKPEFDVNDKGGLYSDETKPVYVKSLGMVLPKYMVEKTDYELDFDKSRGR
ncbi:hypothetical protein RI129_011025 [Pyrocoelia pectoralis]|uniref:Uncharacterized protein n=1 Tax=Pyrocoelia pectoralis TaxID=417401 RepID=A0AAN7VAE7_9COLE